MAGGRRHWTVHGRTYARAGLELTDDEGAASYKGTGQPGFVQEQQVGRVGRGILSLEGAGADGVGGRQQTYGPRWREKAGTGHACWAWCKLAGLVGLLTCAGPGFVSCSRLLWAKFGPELG